MIEIFNIIFLISSILWILSFKLFANKILIGDSTNEEKLALNLSLLLNLFLILSFVSVNPRLVFLLLILLPFTNFFQFKKFNISNISILFFFTFIMSISISSNLRLEWDASALWIYKVINFYNGYTFFNLSQIPGDPTYPHLGAYAWSFFWKNSLFNAEYTGRIFNILVYVLSICLLVDVKNQNLKRIFLISIFLLISIDFFLMSGYQEYFVFSILIIIVYLYQRLIFTKNNKLIFPIILFINISIWIKNEAAFFILFLFISVILNDLLKSNKFKKEIILLFIFFVIFLLTKYYIFYEIFGKLNTGWVGYKFSEIDKILSIDYIYERSISIFSSILIALIKCKIYVLFLLVALFNISKKNFQNCLPLLIFFLINIFFIYCIYFFTNDPDWRHYMSTTVDRLLFQTSGIYLFPILYYFQKILKF